MSDAVSKPDELNVRKTVLRLTDVNQSYNGTSVLDSCNLSLLAGEYCVVLGKSGSGKSTLLRLVAGLLPFDSGRMEINQSCVAQTSPRDRDVSLMFQDDRLYPHWTIRKTLTLACQQGPTPIRSADELNSIATRFQITPILDRRPDQVSGGQLRRASLAKAILRRPAIMLLDEPLHGLDACLREEFLELLANLPRHRGLSRDGQDLLPTAVIHVTHDGEEAMRLADRLAVLDQGQIVQTATPEEVYQHPKTLTVAMLLGSPPPNIVGQTWLDSIPKSSLPDGNAEGNWMVRPESIEVNDGTRPTNDGAIRWQAELVHSCFVNGRWLQRWKSHEQTWRTISCELPQTQSNCLATLSVAPRSLTWVSNKD